MIDHDTQGSLARYVAELFAPEDELLRELRAAISDAGLPAIYISAEEGRLLQVLLKAVGARRVVELGTLGGYSAIWMARALPADGKLVTLEMDPGRAEFARGYIDRAGLADRVDVKIGKAPEALHELAALAPLDAVFIDADKENYPRYLEWSLDVVRSGGLIIADNAFRGGDVIDLETDDPDVVAIQESNHRMATDPRLTSIIVPTRDGVAVAVVN